jgi:hypothetical protein
VAILAFLTGSLSAMIGCDYLPFGYVSMKEIVDNPTQYEGKKIKVKGLVSEVTSIPFLDIRFYALNDRGYQILVVAKETIPAVKADVSMIGVVNNFVVIRNESLGLHLRETKRLDTGW